MIKIGKMVFCLFRTFEILIYDKDDTFFKLIKCTTKIEQK